MLNLPPESFELKPSYAKIACEPNWRWAKRDKPLPSFDLFYVWGGEGEVELNGEIYRVGKGSCFLFRPGDDTSAVHHPQKPLTLTYIHFDLLGETDVLPQPYRIVRQSVWFEKLLTRYVRLLLQGGYGAIEEAQLLLKQLMICLLREEREDTEASARADKGIELQDAELSIRRAAGAAPQDEEKARAASTRLREAVLETANYVRTHPGVPHRLNELAARAGLSPKYFSAKFREYVGESVQAYIIRARVERADHLLRYAGMNVSEVADALGYRDVFFFSRQFKRYRGVAPSEVR